MTDKNESATVPTPEKGMNQGLFALLMLVAAVVFYSPALHGGFLWDDDTYISANWTLQSLKGLSAIWFIPAATCQYYPLTFTAFWTGYHLWGYDTLGYHLLNVAMHCAAAILLWQIMARLRLRSALLAGAIFALHPVNVMSVAWMTELKNTFSGTLALGAAWAYIRFVGLGVYGNGSAKGGRWRFFVLSLVLFQFAMFAKTAVSFLPLTLLMILWWQKKQMGARDALSLLPMFAIAIGMGAFTIYIERHAGGAKGADFNLSFVERVLVSGRSFWFYLGKLFLPVKLSFIYDRWKIDAGDWRQYLYPLVMVAFLAGLWLARRRIGKGIFVTMMHFYVSTSMLVLVVVLFMMRYTFVSDHWQYFGSMTVVALMGEGIANGLDRAGMWGKPSGLRLMSGFLLVLGVLTFRQCGMYASNEILWRTTIEKSPESPMAHENLGNALAQAGKPAEAIPEHYRALELRPDSAEIYSDLGNALMQNGQTAEAIENYKKSLEINPLNQVTQYNLGNLLLHQTEQPDEAIVHLEKTVELEKAMGIWPGNVYAYYDLGIGYGKKGRFKEAIVNYRKTLEIMPQLAPAQSNLAWLLATSPVAALRNGAEALALAQQATQSSDGGDPNLLRILAAAYAENGRFKEAAETAQRALGIAIMRSDAALAESLQAQIALYQAGSPFREEVQQP